MRKLIVLCVGFFLCAQVAIGQVDSLKNLILNNIDSLRIAEVEASSFRIMPFLAPSYMPETKWLFSGGGLITFKAQNRDKLLNLSSIPFSIGYSTNGSIAIRVLNVIYWKKDKMRSIGEFQLREMPDHYWGVGYSNGLNVPKSATTTAYTRKYWRFYQRMIFRMQSDVFVGLVVDFNRTRAVKRNSMMVEDKYVKMNDGDVYNTGLGLVVDYDTRDFVQNAYEGIYLSGSYTAFNTFWGGNTMYNIIDLDYRQYQTIRRKRRTLAWQVKTRFTFSGETPWSDKAMLGGMDNMRGYTLGRFRDNNVITTTAEYRHMFQQKKINKDGNYNSKWGYVAWMGTGTVAPSFSRMDKWLPNGGLGIRYELQPRMNIRFDYGVAKGERGAYITFSEVF